MIAAGLSVIGIVKSDINIEGIEGLKMACCRPSQTQIARDGVKGIIISTIEVNGAPETALIDKNTSYVVAKYNTLRGR
jgi:hypothetical protein